MITRDMVLDTLYEVYDPELGINVVDLGLIYDVEIEDQKVKITMTLTTPGCPLHDIISQGMKNAIHQIKEVEQVDVNLVWSPPWTPAHMSDAAKEQLQRR